MWFSRNWVENWASCTYSHVVVIFRQYYFFYVSNYQFTILISLNEINGTIANMFSLDILIPQSGSNVHISKYFSLIGNLVWGFYWSIWIYTWSALWWRKLLFPYSRHAKMNNMDLLWTIIFITFKYIFMKWEIIVHITCGAYNLCSFINYLYVTKMIDISSEYYVVQAKCGYK